MMGGNDELFAGDMSNIYINPNETDVEMGALQPKNKEWGGGKRAPLRIKKKRNRKRIKRGGTRG